MRQTPNRLGVWKDIQFYAGGLGAADYVVIHGHAHGPMLFKVPEGRVWAVMGEPPNEIRAAWHNTPNWVDRTYSTDDKQGGPRHRLATAYLPWWVDQDFDTLVSMPPIEKAADLSWITSNGSGLAGHKVRMQYLQSVRGLPALDLFGRGFAPIAGKWEGLAPYRYSIAFENHSNAMYFSEKVMDVFLAWTMPIYYGCTDLSKFFPRESYVQIDLNEPDPQGFLAHILKSDLRERKLDAIAEARRRVLYDYNLFNLIADEVRKQEQTQPSSAAKRSWRLVRDHTRDWRQFEPAVCTRIRRTIFGQAGS